MNITISSNTFAAAALFRGINDIRYYLNGLYLETGANGARLIGYDELTAAARQHVFDEGQFNLNAMRKSLRIRSRIEVPRSRG